MLINRTDLELLDTWFDQAFDATKVTDPTGLDGERPGDDDTAPTQ